MKRMMSRVGLKLDSSSMRNKKLPQPPTTLPRPLQPHLVVFDQMVRSFQLVLVVVWSFERKIVAAAAAETCPVIPPSMP